MHCISFSKFRLNVRFSFVHPDDKKDHDAMNKKISDDNDYVWVKGCKNYQMPQEFTLRRTGRHLCQEVKDVLEKVEKWPKSYSPGEFLSNVQAVPHLTNFVDSCNIDDQERPVHSIKRGLIKWHKKIHRDTSRQVWQNGKVSVATSGGILPEVKTDTNIALMGWHQSWHEWKKGSQSCHRYQRN